MNVRKINDQTKNVNTITWQVIPKIRPAMTDD